MAQVYRDRNVKYDCCFHCEERFVGCHATCEKYIKTREEYLELKNKINAERNKEKELNIFDLESKKRMKTHRGNRVIRSRKK